MKQVRSCGGGEAKSHRMVEEILLDKEGKEDEEEG